MDRCILVQSSKVLCKEFKTTRREFLQISNDIGIVDQPTTESDKACDNMDSTTAGDGGGGGDDETGGDDDDGEPPILAIVILAIAITATIFSPSIRQSLFELSSQIFSLAGGAGGCLHFIHSFRKRYYRNRLNQRAILDTLGGAIAGNFIVLPFLNLPPTCIEFLVGLFWPKIVDVFGKGVSEIPRKIF